MVAGYRRRDAALLSRKRQCPPDDELIVILDEHRDLSDRELLTRYGWAMSKAVLAGHRRRLALRSSNPIRGVASMSRDEFRRRMDRTAVTSLDNRI